MTDKKTILHIDFDSFFASVEQQANPNLRGKPIGVTGSSLSKGIICAASREAKKAGVKTAMPIFKAKQICPNLITVKGDFTKYLYIHEKSLEIFSKYSDLVEPFSIDEAFVDITDTKHILGTIEKIVQNIKYDVLENFGGYITCSIGVGPNKLMAKLVSDYNKPNGIFEVTEENINTVLKEAKLQDFCGIGVQIHRRLNEIGVFNVTDLQNINMETLYNEFGNIQSNFLKNLSFGIDVTPVKHINEFTKPKSIGHQHTLSKNTRNMKILRNNIQRLSDMVGRRLRRKNMKGRKISLYLRTKDFEGIYDHITTKIPTNSTLDIYERCVALISKMKIQKEIRLIAVTVSLLSESSAVPLYLLAEDNKKINMTTAYDAINDKFGEFSIFPGNTYLADKTKGKISSFLKH